ncbi:MAG: glycoside hydrolase family 16 protein [Eubacterium sp.]|nr:glycoside hydrolase family 16 protein [Eubacterium sp.]
MRKLMGKVVASVLILALAFGVPIASRSIKTEVKADTYELVWSDEFDGNSLDRSNWTTETGTGEWGWGNNEQQFYRDSTDNIEVSDGTLKIHALKQNYGGKQYTSARMKTQGKQSFKYGKIEARMKLPRFKGAWPAFWMLGDNISSVGWPKCGEMDIMEAINDNNNIYSNLHWSYNNSQADTQGSAYNVGDRTAWHTYGMIWTEKKAQFYVDDKVFQTYSITTDAQMEEFRAKQFIILNLAIGGQWPGYEIDNDAFPDRSTMEVDYVRAYKMNEEPTTKYDGPTIKINHDAVAEYPGNWTSWIGTSWLGSEGSVTPNGDNPSNGFTANITKIGSYDHVDAVWSFQGKLENMTYHKGCTYTYKCDITSDKDKRIYVKVADGNENNLEGGYIDLRGGVTRYYSVDVEIPEDFDSTVSLKFGLGNNSADKSDPNESFNIQVNNVSFKTTASIPDPDYTTTPGPTTTKAPTTKPVTTTATPVVPTTKKVSPTKKKTTVKIGKTKIKKMKRAKKSLKFKLKKIKGATGYQIRYSDSKKFDGYWEKNTRKLKVKLKKLDRKTKYYIKARAYRKHGNVYIFGKFSKRKKVKTK